MSLTHKLEDQGPTSPPLPRLAARSHSGENAPAAQASPRRNARSAAMASASKLMTDTSIGSPSSHGTRIVQVA